MFIETNFDYVYDYSHVHRNLDPPEIHQRNETI